MFRPELLTVQNVTAAAERLFDECFRDAVHQRGSFVVNFAGGSTPLDLYRALARRDDLPWERLEAFWGDERFVPLDHADSNAGQTMRALLDHVGVEQERIHPWPRLDATPEASAEAYAAEVEEILGVAGAFDLTLLGMGENAHVASLFPGTGAAQAGGTTIVVRPEGVEHTRLSMTAPTLSTSRVVAFLVAGERKRPALEGTLAGEDDVDRFPARAVRARERLVLVTDVDNLPRP